MNSVGEEIVQLASPPAAPANQILYRATPSGLVGSVMELSSDVNDRLYATKRIALRAPYPKIGAAAPKNTINVIILESNRFTNLERESWPAQSGLDVVEKIHPNCPLAAGP